MARTPKPEVAQGKDGLWYWHIKAANSKVIAQGEGYSSERSAWRGLETLCATAVEIHETVRNRTLK